jgi:hypothetical protein
VAGAHARWVADGPAEFLRQIWAGTVWMVPMPPALLLGIVAVGAIRHLDRGPIPAGAPGSRGLSGRVPPVAAPLVRRAPGVPAASLADAASRIPTADPARVRVETYTMPGGSRQYVAYVTGTRSMAGSGAEAFDMRSNLQLYERRRSSSYEAAMAALSAAGAAPGATVHLVGHSQGAMVASHIAASGVYEVPTLVTFGSPVQAELGADTLSVAVRHRDDPVSLLAGGGLADGAGAPGSFVAERTGDPAATVADLALGVHGIEAYGETAAMLDEADDPRMDAVRARFAELGAAASVDVAEYGATRAGTRVGWPPREFFR